MHLDWTVHPPEIIAIVLGVAAFYVRFVRLEDAVRATKAYAGALAGAFREHKTETKAELDRLEARLDRAGCR